tara:strand:- start:249 stop:458 length:210 start_codon:yes stop_codon:yes gene_type:complete
MLGSQGIIVGGKWLAILPSSLIGQQRSKGAKRKIDGHDLFDYRYYPMTILPILPKSKGRYFSDDVEKNG